MTSDSGGSGAGLTIRPGRPFWTFVWAFSLNMSGLFVVDSVDVFTQAVIINNWLVAGALSLLFAVGMYAKAKIDEGNGKGEA